MGWAAACARLCRGVPLLLAFGSGIALQLQQPVLWELSRYAALLGLALAGLALCVAHTAKRNCQSNSRRARSHAVALVAWLLVCLLGFAWPGLRAAWFERDRLPQAWDGIDIEVVAVIAAVPRPQADGVRLRLHVEQASDAQGQMLPLRQRLDVAWYAPERFEWPQGLPEPAARQRSLAALPELVAGDRWRLPLRLRAPSGTRNPLVFDYEQWLWQQGVQATGQVRAAGAGADTVVRWLGNSGHYRLQRLRQRVAERIQTALGDTPDAAKARHAAVLVALVTGEQRAIAQTDWELFRITGVAHLMAISGLHITMFAWLAMGVAGRLWRRSRWLMLWLAAPLAALWCGLLLAGVYALFSGWQVPAQRTVLMLAAAVGVRALGLRWPWHATLALAAAVVLVADPWALQQPGFWLSFVAVAILLHWAPSGGGMHRPVQPDTAATSGSPLAQLWRWAGCRARSLARKGVASGRAMGVLQWRISIVLAPLTIALFGQISWVGLLANLLAIPWVTLLVTPLAMAGVLLPPLLPLAAWSVEGLLGLLQWLASWPVAQWHWPKVPPYLAMLGLAGAVLALARWPAWLRCQGLLCLALMLAWRPAAPPAGHMLIQAVDVGQGGAVLVRTHRHVLLYDTGPRYGPGRDAGHSILQPLLQAHGLVPDLLLLSHGDSDHIGGAAAVLRAFAPAQLLAPFEAALLQRTAAPGPPLELQALRSCHAGLRWEWDGVRFAVLYPTESMLMRWRKLEAQRPAGTPGLPRNATSCVLQVTAQNGTQALLTGDIGRLQELELALDYGTALRSDWLQVPHHGSRGASSERFVAAVAPRYAVVQAGRRNRFGHPHPDVVHRYRAQGSLVLTTPQCGAITWHSHRPAAIRCERRDRQRYWQRTEMSQLD